MVLSEEKILQAIHQSIDEMNKKLESTAAISKVSDHALFGNTALDSMDFVFFVMSIEENVGSLLGSELDLMGEDFLAEGTNPFSTISTLQNFIQKKIEANISVD